MTRPHSKATTRERTYTDDRSRRKSPVCRRCGQAGSVHGGGNDPDALVNGLCWDCRQDVSAGGPDGVDVESLIDGMDGAA